ncbi:MAG TPA: adenylate/guanylate cyclase domain-containing protein, partial [Bacillota bacterium]|nr:adenylate/guanylate cyclase domain-containing protein [Bacillota bacterium]
TFTYWSFEQVLKFDWIESLELVTVNFRMLLRNLNGPMKHSDQVIIIGIDDRSLLQLQFAQNNPWPWKRSVFADLVNKIGEGGAKSIIIDVAFETPNPNDLEGDRLFAESMFMNPMVTFGTTLINNKKEFASLPAVYQTQLNKNRDYIKYRYQLANPDLNYSYKYFSTYKLVPPYQLFGNTAFGYGSIEVGLPDKDGMYHTIPLVTNEVFLNEKEQGSFILLPNQDILGLTAFFGISPGECTYDLKNKRILLGKYRSIPVDNNGYFTLNYYGKRTFPEISVIDVLHIGNPAQLQKLFRDKIVLIGYTANSKGLFDLRPTTFNKNEAGIQIHATLLSNILQQKYLTRLSLPFRLGLIFGLLVIFSLVLLTPRHRTGILWSAFLIIAFNIINYLCFLQNLWVDLFYIDIVLLGFFIENSIARVYQENREKLQIKGFFTKYVPAPVVEEILKDPTLIHLGGEKMKITVLFSDIVGFTTISEQLEPVELVRLLNEYLTEMTAIIKDEFGGTLDKFIGDAIVAIFGAPFSRPDDPVRAVSAALAMQAKVAELKRRWQERGEKFVFGIGVGINTGPAVVGNIGSPDRLNYTCIGDTVNTAARLEAATRSTGAPILISAATYADIADYFHCEELPPMSVKGKKEPLVVYHVLSKK